MRLCKHYKFMASGTPVFCFIGCSKDKGGLYILKNSTKFYNAPADLRKAAAASAGQACRLGQQHRR
jgi:hypothetical protein